LQEGEIGIVGNDSFGKGRELDALSAKIKNFLNDLCDRTRATVENGTDLDCGGFDGGHGTLLV
jgi:hypothetical protein